MGSAKPALKVSGGRTAGPARTAPRAARGVPAGRTPAGTPATPSMLTFPDGYTPSASHTFWQCGANMRTNRYVKARITAQIRLDAARLALSQKLPHYSGPVTILAIQHPAEGGRAVDVENVAPLVKAAIDGLRDAQVLVNDSPRWVKRVAYDTGERTARGQLELRINPVDGAP